MWTDISEYDRPCKSTERGIKIPRVPKFFVVEDPNSVQLVETP
jgi:hypothetical protein